MICGQLIRFCSGKCVKYHQTLATIAVSNSGYYIPTFILLIPINWERAVSAPCINGFIVKWSYCIVMGAR